MGQLRLSYERLAEPAKWARRVRAALGRSSSMADAALYLGVSRDTFRLWCRELGITHGRPGRKSTRA